MAWYLIMLSDNIFFFLRLYSPVQALATSMKLSVSLQLLDLGESTGLLGQVDQLVTCPLPVHKHRKATQTLNIHALTGIRTHGSGAHVSEDSSCLRPLGYHDRPAITLLYEKFKRHGVSGSRRILRW
jgi:hypothetical protein